MTPEIKQKWLTALRSGDYAQGHGQLGLVGPCDTRTYCCLGVLCEITERPHAIENSCVVYDGDVGEITDPEEKFGLSPEDMDHLITLNDRDRYTFKQIANWIEANL